MPRQNRPKRETKKQSTKKTTVKKISPSNPPVPTVRESKPKNEIQVQAHVRQRASMRERADVKILTAHPQTETGQKPVVILSKDTA